MRHSLKLLGLAVLSAGSAAYGQAELERFQRTLDQIQRQQRVLANPDVPAGQRALVDYGGFVSLNFFAIDDIEQNTHILRQYDLVGYGRVNIDNVHEVFVRGRFSYQDFNAGDSFDGEGDEWDNQLELAYYRLDVSQYFSAYKGKSPEGTLAVQLGRQFVYWGNGLVLAQTVDGGMIEAGYGKLSLQALAGRTAPDTIDFDSSRPDFDEDTKRAFYGALLTAQLGRHRPFIYGLVQRDHNEDEVLRVGAIDTRFNYDSWYLGIGSNGSLTDRLLYAVEAVYEGGEGLSNSFDPDTLSAIPQTEDDVEAFALDLRLDYLLPDANRSKLTLEGILATGDDDRLNTSNTFGGNRPGTDDTAFNSWGLVNTGLAFVPSVSNLMSLRVGASTFPFGGSGRGRRFQVGADVLFFAKFDKDGPIDEATTADRFLGWEPDVYLNWQITSDITLAIRYGVFFPGSAIVEDDHPRNFFFTGLTFAF